MRVLKSALVSAVATIGSAAIALLFALIGHWIIQATFTVPAMRGVIMVSFVASALLLCACVYFVVNGRCLECYCYSCVGLMFAFLLYFVKPESESATRPMIGLIAFVMFLGNALGLYATYFGEEGSKQEHE